MYDIADLISLIDTGTPVGYTVEYARAKEPVLTELTNLPIIYVGYRTIVNENPSTVRGFNAFEQNGENLTQNFDLSICCELQDLPVVWRKVYASIQGKNTVPAEAQFSALAYQKGGIMGLDNFRVWWLDRIMVSFPSSNKFLF